MFVFDESKVRFEVSAKQDWLEVRGNAVISGDDDYDKSVEDEIIARLNDGDVWAWAEVIVTARYDGINGIEGVDYLGCCTYADEADFVTSGGYYDDMCRAACAELRDELERIYNAVHAS